MVPARFWWKLYLVIISTIRFLSVLVNIRLFPMVVWVLSKLVSTPDIRFSAGFKILLALHLIAPSEVWQILVFLCRSNFIGRSSEHCVGVQLSTSILVMACR